MKRKSEEVKNMAASIWETVAREMLEEYAELLKKLEEWDNVKEPPLK